MKARLLKLAIALVLAFTTATVCQATCKTEYGDISGRIAIAYARSSAELAERQGKGYDLALAQEFPNPLAAHPELADVSRASAKTLVRVEGILRSAPTGELQRVLEPLFAHHEKMLLELSGNFTDPERVLMVALSKQLSWIMENPTQLYVPPFTKFLPVSAYFKKGTYVAMYGVHAPNVAAQRNLVPMSRPKPKKYFTKHGQISPLADAPAEIISVSRKFSGANPLTSLEFSKWAKRLFDKPHTSLETVIDQLVADLRNRYVSEEPWLRALKEKMKSGEITESELAAYIAFYFPELSMQVQLSEVHPAYLGRFLAAGYDSTTGKPSVYPEPDLKDWEAKGWNIRNPAEARPVALALAYLRGKKAVADSAEPVSMATHLFAPASVPVPALVSGKPAVVEFAAPPELKWEMWPKLTFEGSSNHDVSIAADNLMLAHLDVASSLHSARIQFRQSEEKLEHPALRQVEAFLRQKERKPEEFPAVIEAVRDLLALNAAKLKHVESLKAQSSVLLGHMKEGVSAMQSLQTELPSAQGASAGTLEKIQMVLDSQHALSGTAQNAESVDRSLNELGAQVLADKMILTKIVRLLGNPLSFQNVPREPLIESLELLAKDGH